MNAKESASAFGIRVQRPERAQVEMQFLALDQMLPKDHRVRLVWEFVDSLDLREFYAHYRAVSDGPGRPPIGVEVLLALWLYATIEGISSARELARRCETDIVYRWLCGNIGVNYHTLSDFRVEHGECLDKLLTDTVTTLIKQGLVPLETIAQDGMRVRASAGSSSFRREPTLRELHRLAEQRVKQLREQCEDESLHQQAGARERAAQERAARERAERVARALEQVKELQKEREAREKGSGEQARCSTTDPDARRMKMGDGGYRPAFNVQLATDGDSRVILAVEVTNSGSDRGEMAPMHQDVQMRYGQTPECQLVDSAFVTVGDVETVEAAGTKVIGAVPRAQEQLAKGKNPHERQPRDSDAYAAYRERMGTAEYQSIYRRRPSIAEYPNAEFRNRGLSRFRVRGLKKVKAVALLHALAHNLLRMMNFARQWPTWAPARAVPAR
jgi:transposase